MTTMNKMFTTLEKKEIDTESRTIVAWGSRPVQDRDREIIDSGAWDLKNFQKNPVLMLSHDYRLPPVGRVVWIRSTKEGLRFKAEFAKTQMAEEIWSLYRDGFMNAFSVGFIPHKAEVPEDDDKDAPRRIYKDVELLEISCVSIPSCPDALLAAYNNGSIKTKEFRSFIEDQLKQIEIVKGESDEHEKETEKKEQREEEQRSAGGSDREEQEIEQYIIIKDEDDYCECEEPNFENDECRGCGGRRKPRKPKKEFLEEIDEVIGFGEIVGDDPNPISIKHIEEVDDSDEIINELVWITEKQADEILNIKSQFVELSCKHLLDASIESEEVEISEKSGRVLSKKTRATIQRAIDALNELVVLSDKEDEKEDDDEDDKQLHSISIIKEPKLDDIEFEEDDKINKVVKEVFSDLLSNYRIDAKDIVNEAVKRYKGKMF